MSEWDFLWGLKGEALLDAMSTGMASDDIAYLERQDDEQQRIHRRQEWEELKKLRDTNAISRETFKKRKSEIFG